MDESDKIGPVLITVRGGDSLEIWKRESKSDGDFNMVMLERKQLKYE